MNRIACALVVLLLAGCHSKPVKKDVPFDYGQLNADQKTYVNDMKAELTAIASKSVSTGNCNIVISQQAGGKIEAVYAQGGDPGVCEALIKAARSSSERKLPTKPPGMPESYRFEFKL